MVKTVGLDARATLHFLPACIVWLTMTSILGLGAGYWSFHWQAIELASVSGAIILLVICGLMSARIARTDSGLRQVVMVQVARCCMATSLFYAIAVVAALCCSVLAGSALPYTDDMLAAADRALGFDWVAMMAWFQSHPIPSRLLIEAYYALNWEPQLTIILLCCFRWGNGIHRFLTSWALCLLLTILIFPFFPAVAAFHHYGVDPHLMPGPTSWASWNLADLMDGLRTGRNRILGTETLTGIVTMPSFHAASAVLLANTLWTFRWLRWPAMILNSLMFISAVPVGGHYMVDIVAGLGLAMISIILARSIHFQIERRFRDRPLQAKRESSHYPSFPNQQPVTPSV